jgi:hypothetical protein
VSRAVCRRAFVIDDKESPLPIAAFIPAEGGTELLPSATSPESGILRIDGDDGPLAFAVLNSAPRARAALRPREAGRLLDALGRIEHYEGFDDLFDLFERHVLGAEHVSQPA